MGRIRELADALWSGAESTEGLQPVSLMLGLEEMQPGLAFVSSFGNLIALRSSEGLGLIDTGGFFLAGQNHATVREWSDAALNTAIYTHGHVDHAFGVPPFEAEGRGRVEVIAHEGVKDRFDRYQLTAGYNRVINGRQFGVAAWPSEYRYPDRTYRDRLDLRLGSEQLELHHARGETDDHTWVWLPERKVLCTGDLFIWASPNCGNPQKVQRFPREWATALREMAALGAELLLPGHGPPIEGKDRVEQALSETAELLEFLVDATLQRMNAGQRLDAILAEVKAPAHLLARPYLRPVYDEPEFIVRNLWRLYGGWWDGNPADLKPAPAAAVAREIATLVGGAHALVARAEALADAGELALAAHLIELAFSATPGDVEVRRVRSRIYAARSEAESSLMAQNIFRAAADER
ncbi:MAG: MBL fold metallo-hydrolase [Polyangiaceae bacterium]|nr:MBL fold metallo-hydrolase [Polyangiaceae bacterium]